MPATRTLVGVGLVSGAVFSDLDGDGRMDLAAANWGRNTRCERFLSRPLRLYHGDFNGDGSVGLMESCFDNELKHYVPASSLWTLSAALPWLQVHFTNYEAFGRAEITQVLGERGSRARILVANWLSTTVFLNRGDHFDARPLPIEAQMAPAFGVCVADFDADGHEDLFLSQNFFGVRPEFSRHDAGRGLLLRGQGNGAFSAVAGQVSGVRVCGEQRGAAVCDYDGDGRVDLAVTQHGAETKLYRNRSARSGLRIRLQGPAGNPHGIGAMLRLQAGQPAGPARELHVGSCEAATCCAGVLGP